MEFEVVAGKFNAFEEDEESSQNYFWAESPNSATAFSDIVTKTKTPGKHHL
jgi:hypothetical protein